MTPHNGLFHVTQYQLTRASHDLARVKSAYGRDARCLRLFVFLLQIRALHWPLLVNRP